MVILNVKNMLRMKVGRGSIIIDRIIRIRIGVVSCVEFKWLRRFCMLSEEVVIYVVFGISLVGIGKLCGGIG